MNTLPIDITIDRQRTIVNYMFSLRNRVQIMRLITDEKTYDFPNIHPPKIGDGFNLLAYIEDTIEIWSYTGERREAIRQLTIYYRLTDSPVRWINVVEQIGFHNPTTPYDCDADSSPYIVTK